MVILSSIRSLRAGGFGTSTVSAHTQAASASVPVHHVGADMLSMNMVSREEVCRNMFPVYVLAGGLKGHGTFFRQFLLQKPIQHLAPKGG